MSRLILMLSAFGALTWAAVAANQPAADATLSAALRAHVRDARFGVVTSVRGLPLGVREAMQELWDSQTLDIAEPGATFQGTGGTTTELPTRRLAVAACSTEHYCLVYYERGGRDRTWHVLLYHWTPAATRLEWAGAAPAGVTSVEDLRAVILAGKVAGHTGPW